MLNINYLFNSKFLKTVIFSAAFLFAFIAFAMVSKPHAAHAAVQDFTISCNSYQQSGITVMAGISTGMIIRISGPNNSTYTGPAITVTPSISPTPASGAPTYTYENNPTTDSWLYTVVKIKTYNSPQTTPGTYVMTFTGSNGTYSHSCSWNFYVTAYNASVSGATMKCNGSTNPCNVGYNDRPVVSWTSSGTTNCFVYGPPDTNYSSNHTGSSGSYTAYNFQDESEFIELNCWKSDWSANFGTIASNSINTLPYADIHCGSYQTACTINAGDSINISWFSMHAFSCTVSPPGWTGTGTNSYTRSSGPLVATTTFTSTCTGYNGGTSSASVTVTVIPGPYGIITCNGSDTCTIPYNTAATIAWSSNQATSCSITPSGWTGTSGSRSTGNLTSDQTYTINCSGAGGAMTPHTATVTVSPPPLPTGTITCNGASSCTIAYNSAATIAWTTSAATSCTVTPSNWSGTSGSVSTGNLISTTTYTANCSGPGGNATIGSVVVTVSPPPPVTGNILCNGGGNCSINYNTSATISWSSANATSCSVAPNSWTGLSGSQSTGNLTYTTVYTLSCTGPAGPLSPQPSVTVTVLTDFTLNCTPMTTAIALGDTTSFQLAVTRQGIGTVTFAAPTFSPNNANNPSNSYVNNPNASGSGVTSSVISTTMGTTLAAPYVITFSASAAGATGTVTHTCTVNLYISATPPVQPTNIVASNQVCETVDLTWDKGAGTTPAGYRVYRRTQGTGTATDSWNRVGSDIPTTGATSYSYHDGGPLLVHGSNYYAVSSYDVNNLESAKANASPSSIVPRYCGPSLTASDIDLTQVAGHITKSFTGQACSGTSEVASLPANSLFSPNDTVTFTLNICNSGTQDMTGIVAHITAANLTNYSMLVQPSPAGCATITNLSSTAMDFTVNTLTAPPLGVIATSCTITYRATVTLPPGVSNQYQRFQSVADVTADGGLSDHIVTPTYLFGTGQNQPNRNETSAH